MFLKRENTLIWTYAITRNIYRKLEILPKTNGIFTERFIDVAKQRIQLHKQH